MKNVKRNIFDEIIVDTARHFITAKSFCACETGFSDFRKDNSIVNFKDQGQNHDKHWK